MEISVFALACSCLILSCSLFPWALPPFCPVAISAYSLPNALCLLSMKAINNAAVAPIITEPMKTTKN